MYTLSLWYCLGTYIPDCREGKIKIKIIIQYFLKKSIYFKIVEY